jgi:hypothetical protein
MHKGMMVRYKSDRLGIDLGFFVGWTYRESYCFYFFAD